MHDVIVLGAGPAGLAASVYFARQKLNFLVLSGNIGGQTLWSSDVEDFLGFHLLSGSQLVDRFKEHLKDYAGQFEMHDDELAVQVTKSGKNYLVKTDKGKYETRSVLIATGTKHRELEVPGEKEYFGKGVTYCATCDAPLFKGKAVHVIGGGNSAMDAALFLDKYADSVSIVTINPDLTGEEAMKTRIRASGKIKILTSTKTTKIVGEGFVTGIGLSGPDGKERVEPTQGVFIEIGLIPVSDFVDFVGKDKIGQIIVDRKNRTSDDGVYAAGDVTDVTEKQIAVAVGEGSKAALQIIKYLEANA